VREYTIVTKRIVLTLLLCITAPQGAIAEKLFIFLPTDTRIEAVEQAVAQACPAFTVTAFERAGRFWRTFQKTPPQAVITTGLVLSRMNSFELVATGVINSPENKSSHLLVSITRPPPPIAQLDNVKLGALGELSRQSAKTYFSQQLPPSVKVKHASKPRDLLSLLTLDTVEYLLVDQRTFRYLKQISKQHFQTRKIEMNMPSAISAVRTNATTSLQTDMVACLERLNSLSYNQSYFSIDSWQRRQRH
jgi:hypothetical protein